jgi:hypothetical protein
MRRVTHRLAITALVLATAVLAGCGGDEAAPPGALPARTVEAGEVTVKITPQQITTDGASFSVVFDTHSVELDLDVVAASQLVVDGERWTAASWDGAGPGGHHREGTLTFDAVGDASGTAVLTIDGLPESVEATWDLEAS